MGSWRGEKWSLTGSYFPVTNVNLSAAYKIFGPYRVKFGLARMQPGQPGLGVADFLAQWL